MLDAEEIVKQADAEFTKAWLEQTKDLKQPIPDYVRDSHKEFFMRGAAFGILALEPKTKEVQDNIKKVVAETANLLN